MTVATNTYTCVKAGTQARSVVWTVNETARLFQEIILQRGLSLTSFHKHLEKMLELLRGCLLGHYLNKVILEVFDPVTDRLIERFDFLFGYDVHPQEEEKFDTKIGLLENLLADRAKLPAGCHHRIVLCLKKGAPLFSGSRRTRLRDIRDLRALSAGTVIDTAAIDTQLDYWIPKEEIPCK